MQEGWKGLKATHTPRNTDTAPAMEWGDGRREGEGEGTGAADGPAGPCEEAEPPGHPVVLTRGRLPLLGQHLKGHTSSQEDPT